VKRHLTSIYGKLDAHSRVLALRRAVAAGLLDRDNTREATSSFSPMS
jgi:hypothetical protein